MSSDLPCLIVDERHIRQVIINLLNNAVKFTPLQGEISLEVIKKTECVEIAIRDTGIGIAPEDLEKIFQPFIQVDSALNRQYRGTGLGLALVKKIVEMHNGQVKVTSKIGEGSCFTVSLPYDESTPCTQQKTEDCSQTRSFIELISPEQKLPLVLLAEDNEANIMTISSYLKAKGYEIIIARNGVEAIEKSKRERPDLVLMDIQMPEIDGLQAIKEIRQQQELENIPIIALTALVMQGDREKCLESGASEYMTKPVKLSQLTMKIHQLLLTEAHLS